MKEKRVLVAREQKVLDQLHNGIVNISSECGVNTAEMPLERMHPKRKKSLKTWTKVPNLRVAKRRKEEIQSKIRLVAETI